ncbi:MAG: hypothetical protein WAO95_18985 [Burkholderiales bacterium]
MRARSKILVAFVALAALVLGWGYWHALNHAYLHIRVDDYALKSERLLYDSPHDVTLVLRDGANAQLAVARSVEPAGYILAVHPSAEIGNCEHRGSAAAPGDHAACYERYSAWSADWAPRVRSAEVRVGSCELRDLPVTVRSTNEEWLVWWVPLVHVGGLPRRYFEFSVAVDSRSCKAVAAKRP